MGGDKQFHLSQQYHSIRFRVSSFSPSLMAYTVYTYVCMYMYISMSTNLPFAHSSTAICTYHHKNETTLSHGEKAHEHICQTAVPSRTHTHTVYRGIVFTRRVRAAFYAVAIRADNNFAGAKNFCDGCLCQPQVHTVILIFRLIHAKHNDILTAHFASSTF